MSFYVASSAPGNNTRVTTDPCRTTCALHPQGSHSEGNVRVATKLVIGVKILINHLLKILKTICFERLPYIINILTPPIVIPSIRAI